MSKETESSSDIIIVAMALVRAGWQMASDHLYKYCINKKVSPDFMDEIFNMMDERKKREFDWDKLRAEFEKLGRPELMPPTHNIKTT